MTWLLLAVVSSVRYLDARTIQIAVRDETNQDSGVPSEIILLEGEKRIAVDTTGPDGKLSMEHNCALGQRFVAQPKDASFYESNKVGCKQDIELFVTRRQTPVGELVWRESKVLKVTDGSGMESRYLLSWKARLQVQKNGNFRVPQWLVPESLGNSPNYDHFVLYRNQSSESSESRETRCKFKTRTNLERTLTLISGTGDPLQVETPLGSQTETGKLKNALLPHFCDGGLYDVEVNNIKTEARGTVESRLMMDLKNISSWAGEKGYSVEITDSQGQPR